MTIIQLEYVVAVDNHRHFAKAAEACFVTQPTLSMQIQKLEDQLGIIIFDRSKHPVVPTEIGQRVINQARKIIAESKRVNEIIAEEKDEVAGELHVGIIPTLAPYLLPLFVKSFVEKYPKVQLHVKELITDQVLSKIQSDELDIGIIVTPCNDDNLIEKPIFYEEFMGYLGHRHPLYQKKELNIDDVEYNDLWMLNEGHCFRNQVLNICHPDPTQKLKKKFIYESGSLEALRRIVDQHGGMTLLPELATLDMTQADKKKIRPFNDPKPIREVSIVMQRAFLKQKLIEALYSTIIEAIPGHINSQKNGNVISWK